MSPASPARLPWIDHLRTAAIVLVVNMHAGVTYSHVDDFRPLPNSPLRSSRPLRFKCVF